MTDHPDHPDHVGRPDPPEPADGIDGIDEVDLRPIAESSFAVEHGLIRSAPDVAVDGPAVGRARNAVGLTTDDVAEAMTRRGYTTDPASVAALEDSAAYRMRPREARLLAAILDLPLGAIEATAVPWPADPEDLAALRVGGADPVILGAEVVVRTSTGSHLGVLRCPGDAAALGSRTYRLAAATLLNGTWSHLAGALLVTHQPPYQALAVDALDCVTRSHAPSGVLGFSRLAEPEPLAAAVADYDQAYSISWSDPPPLGGLLAAEDPGPSGWAARLAAVADRLGDEARRSRQPGKRPGYEAAAAWLQGAEHETVIALIDQVAAAAEAEVEGAGDGEAAGLLLATLEDALADVLRDTLEEADP